MDSFVDEEVGVFEDEAPKDTSSVPTEDEIKNELKYIEIAKNVEQLLKDVFGMIFKISVI